jgi:choline dehydrogenase
MQSKHFSASISILWLSFCASYLATTHDMEALVRSLKLVLRLVKTEPLASLVDFDWDGDSPEVDNRLLNATDEELRVHIRERISTLYV